MDIGKSRPARPRTNLWDFSCGLNMEPLQRKEPRRGRCVGRELTWIFPKH